MDFEKLIQFERINVIGTSGSGKSTFARELASVLDLPFFEMDRMYWKENWRAAADDELFQEVRDVTSRQRWIIDGNYTRTIPEKWKHVQLVIWIDLSFVRTVFRVTKRAIHRSFTRQELWPGTGNYETLRQSFMSKDSVIWWAISTHHRNRNKFRELFKSREYSHIRFLRLDSVKKVAKCLKGFREAMNC